MSGKCGPAVRKNRLYAIAEEAAKKCIDLNSCKYFTFKQILKKLNVKELSGAPPKALPEHENIRGKDYYK